MKKTNLTLPLAVLFLLLFFACQQEDDSSFQNSQLIQQSSTTKSVSASEIPKVMQFLQSKSNNRLEFIIDDSNSELGMYRSHEENLSITTALTDQIKMVTNDYGKSNYTFKLIEEQTKEGVYFLNLVVKEYKDGFYMYIVKYVPDTNWLSNYTDKTSFSSFTGDLYIYNVEGIYVGKIGMLDGVISAFAKHPCPGDGEENDTDDHVDNNSGGAGNSGNGTESSGESSSSSSSTGNSSSTGGGGGENITIICGCGPEHSENQIMTGHCTCDTIIITVGDRSMSEALRHPCDEAPEECFDAVGDPCTHGCDEDGNCIEDNDEIENSGVGIDIDISIVRFEVFLDSLTEEQQQFLEENVALELQMQQFFNENGFTNMNENLVENITHVLMNNENLTFNEVLDEIGVIPTILDENEDEDEFFEYIDGSQEELLSFDSIDELTSFINSIEADETSQEQITYELEERRDELYYRISNYPDTELLVTVRLEEPESEDECMSILSVNTTLVGDESFYEWTQLDSSSEPFVIIDEPNNQVVVEIKGKLQIGINFSGNPFRITKIYTIRLVYNYSTSNLIIGGIYDIH